MKSKAELQKFKKFLKSNNGEVFIRDIIALRDVCNKLAGNTDDDEEWLKKMRANVADINDLDTFEGEC